MEQEVLQYIMNLLPSLTAVFTAIGALIMVFVNMRRLFKENTRERDHIRHEMRALNKENAELKQQLNKTLQLVYRVKDDGKEK